MTATTKQPKRFVTMCVPTADGGAWFVYDRVARRSVECHDRATAAEVCRLANASGELK